MSTEVVVVAEQPIYDALSASGLPWNLQKRAETVRDLWDGLADGTLSQASTILFFSDQYASDDGSLETAIATMAPHATVFVVVWNPQRYEDLKRRVAAAAASIGEEGAPFHLLPTTDEKAFLNAVRNIIEPQGEPGIPDTWPEGVTGLFPQRAGQAAAPTPPPVAPVPEPAPEPTPVPVAAPEPIAPPTVVAQPVVAVAPVQPPAPEPAKPPVTAPSVVGGITRPNPQVGANGGPIDGYVAPATNTTLTFFSSKGGSGKSTCALSTAATIAHASEAAGKPLRVVLVDMDTRDGQVASFVGAYAPTALNVRVAENWDEETVLRNLVHNDKLKIDCLLAPVRPRTADDVGPEFYRHVIRVLQKTHDVVVMDCSVNYLDPLIATVCLPEAKGVIFVTTMATTAVQGMARALREITEPVEKGGMGIPRSKIGIVVNQSIQGVGLDKQQITQAALGVPLIGAIPLSTEDVLRATNETKMHFLLRHKVLGPAYLRLARVCLPNAALADITGGAAGPEATPPTPTASMPDTVAPGAPPVAPGQVAPPVAVAPPPATAAPARRRLGFRKG